MVEGAVAAVATCSSALTKAATRSMLQVKSSQALALLIYSRTYCLHTAILLI